MRWADVFTALMAAVWGYLFLSGVDVLIGIKAQHVPGYPAFGQIILYAAIPVFFLLLLAGAVVLSRKARWFYNAYPFGVGATAFAVFPVLMVWGGGV